MKRRLFLDKQLLAITIQRLCQQLVEVHQDFSDSVIIGLQPRGVFLAHRIVNVLENITGKNILLGYLDTTFHRDDFKQREEPVIPSQTKIDFLVTEKKVILIDDVLFTGRSVRAAFDALNHYGRPNMVELLVLIDRLYCRDVPIQANYVGKKVNTLKEERVLVELEEQGGEDNIYLINQSEWEKN